MNRTTDGEGRMSNRPRPCEGTRAATPGGKQKEPFASLFKGDVKRALKALPYRTPSVLKGCYRIAKIEEHAIRRQSLAQR